MYFGFKGLGRDTRNSKGKLLPAGRSALIGIIITACLGVLAGVAEYFANKDKDKQSAATTAMLKRGEQRTSYPARGILLSFDAPLDADFPGLSDYKKTLAKELGNKHCPTKSTEFSCLSPLNPWAFAIPRTSRLFPRAGSAVFEFMANLVVHIAFITEVPKMDEAGKTVLAHHYSGLGSKDIYWHGKLTDAMSLIYYSKTNDSGNSGRPGDGFQHRRRMLAFRVTDYPEGGRDEYGLGISSIVDFIPGAIAVAESMSETTEVCDSMHIPKETCEERLVALNKVMHFDRFDLSINGLQKISVIASPSVRCPSEYYSYLVSPLAGDLDVVKSFYQLPTVKPDIDSEQVCKILAGN
jgi:hypothetical protein